MSLRALAHAAPFLFTAAGFVLSLISGLVVTVEPDRTAAEPESAGAKADGAQRSGMLAGINAIWASPVLRVAATLFACVNAVGAGFGIITVVILRDQSVPPALIGIALSGEAVGGLAGAALVRPLHRLPPGVLVIMVSASLVPLMALLAVPYGPWWMAGLLFLSMLGVPSARVFVDVLILRQALAAERGRVLGAIMTLITIGMPAGLAVTGLLLQYLPAQAAVLVLAGLLAVAVLLCAIHPELWRARWPE